MTVSRTYFESHRSCRARDGSFLGGDECPPRHCVTSGAATSPSASSPVAPKAMSSASTTTAPSRPSTDLGAKVDYIFSGWSSEKMIQQLREAIGAKPNGTAMMGHPGNAAIMPLAEEASNAVSRGCGQECSRTMSRRSAAATSACRTAGHGPGRGSLSPLACWRRGDRDERLVADRARRT